MYCTGNIIFENPLDFMHCVASRFGYPNYRLSELSLVPISSDNRQFGYLNYRLSELSLVPISSDNRRSTILWARVSLHYVSFLPVALACNLIRWVVDLGATNDGMSHASRMISPTANFPDASVPTDKNIAIFFYAGKGAAVWAASSVAMQQGPPPPYDTQFRVKNGVRSTAQQLQTRMWCSINTNSMARSKTCDSDTRTDGHTTRRLFHRNQASLQRSQVCQRRHALSHRNWVQKHYLSMVR